MKKLLISVIGIATPVVLVLGSEDGRGVDRGILFRHGDSLGLVSPRRNRDLVLATQAAWSSTYDSLVYASPNRPKTVAMRTWRHGQPEDRVLPVPPVDTALTVEWQWSFSPDGRWLAVRRRVERDYRWLVGLVSESLIKEANRVRWLGVVDLHEGNAAALSLWGGIVGWQGGRVLISKGQYKPLVAIDPSNPGRLTTLIKNSGSLQDISADGSHAVVYDGREGNIKVTLTDLTGGPDRPLFAGNCAEAGEPCGYGYGALSPDGSWVSVMTLLKRDFGWRSAIRLQSIDGSVTVPVGEFDVPADDIPKVVWSPKERFCYLRRPVHGDGTTLEVVTVVQGAAKAVRFHLNGPQENGHMFPPLWSPGGTEVAVLVKGRHAIVCDVATGKVKIGGKLPDDATFWTWASPRVAGRASQD